MITAKAPAIMAETMPSADVTSRVRDNW